MAVCASTTIPTRRGFLSSLASLPFIGGGVKLIGAPSAAAVPVSLELLRRYRLFLNKELFATQTEIVSIESPRHFVDMGFSLSDPSSWRGLPLWWPTPDDHVLDPPLTHSPASTRAAVVLGAAGVGVSLGAA